MSEQKELVKFKEKTVLQCFTCEDGLDSLVGDVKALVKSFDHDKNNDTTEDDIRLIRTAWKAREFHLAEAKKLSAENLSIKFDIQRRRIYRIVAGEIWRHV